MATLHTVNKSPFEKNSLESCIKHLCEGDSVLMIEDAVIGVRKGSSTATALEGPMKSGKVYALAADLAARGIKPEQVMPETKIVDYGGFVDLVAQHDRTVAWL